jgi:hypothetical protein
MSVERINLIPAERRMGRRQRARAAPWAIACGVYAVAAIAIAPALSEAGADSRALETQQRRLERDIEIVAEASAGLARDHRELMRSSRLTHELRGSADWGRLLGAVAATIGTDAALEGLALAPREKEPGYIMRLSGLAVGQRAITQIALQLEELAVGDEPLFASVKIQDSRRRMIGATQAVTFVIECALSKPGELESGEEER